MSWDNNRLRALRLALAELYPRETQQRAFAKDAGLAPARIGFEPAADLAWFNIIEEARKAGRVDAVLANALAEYPADETLKKVAANQAPEPLPAPVMARDLPWHGPANARPTLEKIMGSRSALVSVSFLERGIQSARAVARVRLPGGSGTGFLVKSNLLITNNHVLPSAAIAREAVAQFNYQQTVAGLDAEVIEYALAPDEFFATSKENDWSAVRVKGDPGSRWGMLDLVSTPVAADDRVNIIQHAGGGSKQLSFYANVVVFVGQGRVQYLTDTLPGSSGSPVFDRDWRLVAVHHSGGWLVEPGSKENVYYRNEGILIDVVIAGLKAAGAPE